MVLQILLRECIKGVMQKELEEIKELAQTCLDNLNERHYYRSPNEANTIDNLKNIVLIVNNKQIKKQKQKKKGTHT